MSNFDRDFDRSFARMSKAIIFFWIFSALLSLATLVGAFFLIKYGIDQFSN